MSAFLPTCAILGLQKESKKPDLLARDRNERSKVIQHSWSKHGAIARTIARRFAALRHWLRRVFIRQRATVTNCKARVLLTGTRRRGEAGAEEGQKLERGLKASNPGVAKTRHVARQTAHWVSE